MEGFSPKRGSEDSPRCPSCGSPLPRGRLLRVATSAVLPDDPVLGSGQALRFLPSRFNPTGSALDPAGGISTILACPSCRGPLSDLRPAESPELGLQSLSDVLDLLEQALARRDWLQHHNDLLESTTASIAHMLGITTEWIDAGLLDEPLEYSLAAGNLVLLADRVDRLARRVAEVPAADGEPPNPDWEVMVTKLNEHHLMVSEFESFLDGVRRCHEDATDPIERLRAWKRLRAAAPRLSSPVEAIRELEPILADWALRPERTEDDLHRFVELLKGHRPLTQRLVHASNQIRETWTASQRTRLARELGASLDALDQETSPIEDFEALAATITSYAETGALPPGIDWHAEAQRLTSIATSKRKDAMLATEAAESLAQLERTLDEGAGLRTLEKTYALARSLNGPLSEVMESRVRRRLELERTVRLRRMSLFAVLGIALVTIGAVLSLRHLENVRRRDLIARIETQAREAIENGRLASVEPLLLKATQKQPDLETDPAFAALRQAADAAIRQRQLVIEDACQRLLDMAADVESGRAIAEVRASLVTFDTEGIPADGGTFQGCLEDARARVDREEAARVDAGRAAMSIPLEQAFQLLDDLAVSGPATDRARRFRPESWGEVIDAIARSRAEIAISLSDHSERLEDLADLRRRLHAMDDRLENEQNKCRETQGRLERGLAALRDSETPIRTEQGFHERLQQLAADHAGLLEDIGRFSQTESSIEIAASLRPLQTWRETFATTVLAGCNPDAAIGARRRALEAAQEFRRLHPGSAIDTAIRSAVTMLEFSCRDNPPPGERAASALRSTGLDRLARVPISTGVVYARRGPGGVVGYLLSDRDLQDEDGQLPDRPRGITIVGPAEIVKASERLDDGIRRLEQAEGIESALELLGTLDAVRASKDDDPLLVLHILVEGWRLWLRDFEGLVPTSDDLVRTWLTTTERDHRALLRDDWIRGASDANGRRSEFRVAKDLILTSPEASLWIKSLRNRIADLITDLQPTLPVGIAAAVPDVGAPRMIAWLDGVPIQEDLVVGIHDATGRRAMLVPVRLDEQGRMLPVAGAPGGPLLIMRRRPTEVLP